MDMNKPFRDAADGTDIPNTPKDYGLQGSLSYLLHQSDSFSEDLFDLGVTIPQGKGLWGFYTKLAAKNYDQHLLKQGQDEQPPTRQMLSDLQFDRMGSGFDELCAELGISSDLANDIWGRYESRTTEKLENIVEHVEAQQAEVEVQVNEVEADDSPTRTSAAEARAFRLEILRNEKHPYNDPNATMEDHDRAVASVNRLLEIENGLASNLDHMHDEINERYNPKHADFSSSNGERPSKSLDQPEFREDDLSRGGESSSSEDVE